MLPRGLVIPAVLGIVLAGCAADESTAPSSSGRPAPGRPALAEGSIEALVQEVRERAAERGIGPLARPAPVRPELVRLGQALAFDKILSGNRDISCMTCHVASLGTGQCRLRRIGITFSP